MKLRCLFGLHSWRYIDNPHGGRPMRRECQCCHKRQVWDYDAAREHGRIVWLDLLATSGVMLNPGASADYFGADQLQQAAEWAAKYGSPD